MTTYRPLTPILLFVYGTLKTGQPNNYHMTTAENGYSKLLSKKAHTVKSYPLVIASRFNIPFLLDRPGIGHQIEGEVYEIDEKMLSFLDKFEGHPQFYERREELVEVQMQEDLLLRNGDFGAKNVVIVGDAEQCLVCWAYFLRKFNDELLLKLPMMACYDSLGSHDLQYDQRDNASVEGDIYRRLCSSREVGQI